MKKCNHTFWLSLCSRGNGADLLVSDRLQHIINYIPNPNIQSPSLLVFIGNTAKAVALKELFSVKRTRLFNIKRSPAEIHLHVDPSSVFRRPLLIADGDLSERPRGKVPTDKCHEIRRHPIQGSRRELSLDRIASGIYAQLLSPFSDVFCFFCDDLGGFRHVARHLAAWLEHGNISAVPASTRPRVILVTENIPQGVESEKEAKETFIALLSEETNRNLFEHISAIEVVALFPNGSISADARHRSLKERLMGSSDQVRKNREDAKLLFSTVHFAALMNCAYHHFSDVADEQPFDFIRASRTYNPIATEFAEHISNFLRYVKSPVFHPEEMFKVLYGDIFTRASKNRVIAFENSTDVALRSGFINMVKKHFVRTVERLTQESKTAVEIHYENLRRYKAFWSSIQSSSTCLSCLCRRPQYGLHCGHIICENCVIVLGECCENDPWVFKIKQCPLCEAILPEEVSVRTHPPTAGVGVLCIDGGGIRGLVPLKLMQRIQDQISLPIPFQRFIKVAFGISSGGLITADIFLNGCSVEKSTERFEKLARLVFQRRRVLNFPFLPHCLKSLLPTWVDSIYPLPFLLRFLEIVISYFADGLYPSENIEVALKQVFGTSRSILDFSHTTYTGTRLGLPVAITDNKPSCRIFTNYNGVGERHKDQDYVMKPNDGFGSVLLWEIARAISAAPGFFPPKHIHGVGTFQDAGPLENDPLISALSEVAAIFPLVEEPDFVVSLGTGEPKPSNGVSTAVSRNVWKNGAFPRLCRLFWEKMRDKKVRQAFQTHPRYHRLNIQFDNDEPRLDDMQSIPEVVSKAREDDSLSETIENIARCAIASLFYFELDSPPQLSGGKYIGTGYILCSITNKDPAFRLLLDRLSSNSAQFLVNDCPVVDISRDDMSYFDGSGNFRKKLELNTDDKFSVSLKQDFSKPCNISGSPFSVDKLVLLQGFSAVFGRPDHRKRKASRQDENPKKKQPKLRR